MANREIYSQVLLTRGGTEIDAAEFVTRIEVNLGNVSSVGTGASGGDGVVRQAYLVFQNDNDNRFSPLDASSIWNYDGQTFDPLLKPNRELKVFVAAMPQGTNPTPNDYELMFHGYMGDSIRTQGQTIEVELRDLAKRLQDRFITATREYGAPIEDGGVRADLVMQQILDDEFGPGVISLYVPDTPPFACPPFIVEYVSVWDILQNIAKEFGWFLGYRYHAPTKEFRLTLLEPPRDKNANNADWHFDWKDDIYIQDLDVTDRDIRNEVVVVYRDEAGERQSVSVNDPVSIAEFGLRPMQIDESDTDLIKTGVSATALGNLALADLSGQRATNSLTLPFIPRLDLYDGITVDDPRISSETEFYGVESLRQTLDFDGGVLQSEVVAAGRVIGSHQRWLMMQARDGSVGKPPGDVWPVRPNTVISVAASNTPEEGKRRADIVCTGEHDQRDINRAINRLNSEGGKVSLLEGTFNISDSIILKNNVTLEGQGEGTQIKIADGLTVQNFFVMIHRDATPIEEGQNIRIYDLVLDGNFRNNNIVGSMYGIIFDYTRDSWVRNVRFTRIREYPFACFSSNAVFVSDNVFVDCGDSIDFASSEKCYFMNNVIQEPFFWGGVRFYSNCSDFVVTGNQFFDVIDYSGCIQLQLCESFRLSGNIMKNVGLGFGLDQGVNNCTIIQNEVVNADSNGLRIWADDQDPSSDNVITNNVFVDCALDGFESDFAQVLLKGESNRNTVQSNLFRLKNGIADYCVALRTGLGDTPKQNHIDNNDFLNGYTDDSIFDGGIDTDIGTGNRPFSGGSSPMPTSYYTDFTDWPLGETPFDWFGWHYQDYYTEIYTTIEDGATALFFNVNTGSLWRIWGPQNAPAARNIEIFTEFKLTSTSTGNQNPVGVWMRVSGWNDARLGGIYLAADGTSFALKRRNFTSFSTLNVQSGAIAADNWYKVRFRAEDNTFYGKIWPSGSPEPAGWTVQATETTGDHQTGARIGLGRGTTTGNAYFRQFGYAIGGATAPGN